MVLLMGTFRTIVNKLYKENFNVTFHRKYKHLLEKVIALLFFNKMFLKIVHKSILFLRESFNLWSLFLMITLYQPTKILISFWYRRGLNHRSLIQLSETLPVKLTGTHVNQYS